ncbi:MAG: D-amino acid aminotransferase [Dethiobacter sp.]|jgi:D-alanine transaminase|nr:D-amino acid aminotransferase [Dethiobacter sp.]
MQKANVFLNGEFLPAEKAWLNVEDRGTLFGDGVYEYIIAYNGKLFQADEHLDRLWRSAGEIEIPMPYSRDEIKNAMKALVGDSKAEEAGLYIELTRGSGPRIHHFPDAMIPNFFIVYRELQPLEPSVCNDGIGVLLLPDQRWKRCDIKTLNLLPNVLAKQKAIKSGFYDAILYGELGVTEATSNSVLTVLDGVLTTAPLGPWILPGVTRKTVLELAREDGIPVSERFFTPQELKQAQEVMITGTRCGIAPVVAIDKNPVAAGKPGPVYKRLKEMFNNLIASL